jgi:hypothetical protein
MLFFFILLTFKPLDQLLILCCHFRVELFAFTWHVQDSFAFHLPASVSETGEKFVQLCGKIILDTWARVKANYYYMLTGCFNLGRTLCRSKINFLTSKTITGTATQNIFTQVSKNFLGRQLAFLIFKFFAAQFILVVAWHAWV